MTPIMQIPCQNCGLLDVQCDAFKERVRAIFQEHRLIAVKGYHDGATRNEFALDVRIGVKVEEFISLRNVVLRECDFGQFAGIDGIDDFAKEVVVFSHILALFLY